MKTYSALIIDDEVDNISLLKIYLSKYVKAIDVVYTATTVENGINTYLEHQPDILFLDIKLDGEDTSFQIIDAINNLNSEIVFISSYDEYAIKAISVEATGYIIKPIQINELVNVTEKAIKNIENKIILKQSHADKASEIIDFIAIPSTNKIDVIHPDDILYLEADGRYTIFHLVAGKTIIASRNLGEYEKQLSSAHFFRIHHRYIVNLSKVATINKSAGNYCELINNKSLPIAKRRQDLLHRFLKIKS